MLGPRLFSSEIVLSALRAIEQEYMMSHGLTVLRESGYFGR
jgi:hypothetical protein